MTKKRAVIIGAGPAGLTAAFEFQRRSEVQPVILEKSDYIGGISRTVNYKGNRIDIGGHRFFSKSERVMRWWNEILPVQAAGESEAVGYQGQQSLLNLAAGVDPERNERVMLLRPRKSRIYFLRRFFDYPITLSTQTIRNLGIWRVLLIGLSYLRSVLLPIRNEQNLEQFFINRFGRRLYQTFFKSYTEKVWGVPCDQISAEWGAQRIKGLSIWRTLTHMAAKFIGRPTKGLRQNNVETSLIEQFLYPKLGPGQMWEEVARRVLENGAALSLNKEVCGLRTDGKRILSVEIRDRISGEREIVEGDYFFSTMPIRELIASLDCPVDENVRRIAEGLQYRDFITVGLLLRDLKLRDEADPRLIIKDNWIYIQEPDVLVGRMQIFNNWSPWMVKDPGTVWVGLEYFCNQGDSIWGRTDAELLELGKEEMERIGIISPDQVLDGCVIRMEKTYPAYFGTYGEFDTLREWIDQFSNLYLIGRNGMHRYNNQDHSMLTAMQAVDNILAGNPDKRSIWEVNTEQDYHEDSKPEVRVAEADPTEPVTTLS